MGSPEGLKNWSCMFINLPGKFRLSHLLVNVENGSTKLLQWFLKMNWQLSTKFLRIPFFTRLSTIQ